MLTIYLSRSYSNSHPYLLVDFNIHWNNVDDSRKVLFQKLFKDLDLNQNVFVPTNQRKHKSVNLQDIFLAPHSDNFHWVFVSKFMKAEHKSVEFELDFVKD